MEFNFYMPTKAIFGINCVDKHSHELKKIGKKCLVVCGKKSAEINGSLTDIGRALKKESIEFKVFNEIEPNPSIKTVTRGGMIAREFGAEFIIGIGGGSPMDAAKAIAILTNNEFSEDVFTQSYKNKALPMVAVPTTAGTGSEVTPFAIVTDPSAQTKRSIAHPDIFPRVSFLDGKYMISLPKEQTINTVIDAFSHSAEGYLSARSTPMSDALALESIKLIGKYFKTLKECELSIEDRDSLLYASMLAGVVIAQSGTTICHGMGYSLTYFRGEDHGRANGLLFPAFLRHCQKEQDTKVSTLINTLGFNSIDEFESEIKNLLGDRITLSDEELELFSEKASKTGNVMNTIPKPSKSDIKTMFETSFK